MASWTQKTQCVRCYVEHSFGGHARILHGRSVCDWLQEEAGFSAARHYMEQRFVMRGHLDHQTATWQLMPFTRCDGVCGLEGHAMQGGHIEHRLGGHARTIHHRGVCDWLQEVVGFPAGRHQAEQSPVRRGHLDHQSATWQLIHFTRRVGVDGLKGHALQGGHVEHRRGGHARTHHHGGWFQEDAGFPTVRHQAEQRLIRRGHLDHHKVCVTVEFVAGFMLAFQLSGIKQNRGSSGEGVWIIKRKLGNCCNSYGEG